MERFSLVGTVEYARKRDGKTVRLNIWEGRCRACRKPYRFKLTERARTFDKAIRNCGAHRGSKAIAG